MTLVRSGGMLEIFAHTSSSTSFTQELGIYRRTTVTLMYVYKGLLNTLSTSTILKLSAKHQQKWQKSTFHRQRNFQSTRHSRKCTLPANVCVILILPCCPFVYTSVYA